MEWNAVGKNNFFLNDRRLTACRSFILVTYKTPQGRRYVKQVECLYGRVSKKLNGEILAWMPLPEPYQGSSPCEQIYGNGLVRLSDIET